MIVEDDALKAARAEIEAVMQKYDVAGYVAMHRVGEEGTTPKGTDGANTDGRGESFFMLQPSYSKLTGTAPQYRFKCLRADYGTTQDMMLDANATINMLAMLASMVGQAGLNLLSISTGIEGLMKVQHGEEKYEPDHLMPSKLN